MLELGVDEITVVLQLSPNYKNCLAISEWEEVAENLIDKFVKKSGFITVYGDMEVEQRPPQGYTYAYKFGEHNFYLAVAYHTYQLSMGIAVKLSAQALDYYCEATGLKVYQFLQKITEKEYTIRLSRIDLTADYIDEDVDVTGIYQSLMDNKVGIFREYISKKTGETAYKRSMMQYEGYLKEKEVPTIYIGSVQSNSRIRIYDKKREQIERKGVKFDKAIKCDNWVRFEGVFRHEFSHQISEELLKIKTDIEFANLIACTLAQKYRFMIIDNGVINCDTEYTQMLLDCISNKSFALKAPSSRNYDIAKSVAHIFFGSGVMSTLYKIKEIWGKDAVGAMMKYISDSLDEWKPNDDCRYWLRKNTSDYRMNYSDFDTFMRDNISNML
ncbi:MAG: replication initiation factor domain-containing protein [Eubacteriaceae bacterium]|nr:replication initiation factor domain-containing protein [Eubacteriaceae bacterium]